MKAVEFDGVEFHGRVLTVKLDDGRRLKDKTDERARWLEGYDGVGYRSQWHKERESSRNPRIGKQLFGFLRELTSYTHSSYPFHIHYMSTS
ncbi:hypothetical protein DVH24_006275 [Malus domestica]|uniref:Uncharacterized protein n=1 Tax=Malus domestica TaxID=3750 RepID=A0A498KBW9_MALDO|nr:hypothetical protein DVH24_006275 [Malus domestica]